MTALNESNFDSEVLASSEPYLVDFWGAWCGPCLALAPVIDKLAEKYKVGKVNIDENTELSAKYRISAVPTVIIFKNGEPVKHIVGLCSEADLVEAMESAKS